MGYRAMITFNPEWTAYSYKLFFEKEDAERYAQEQLAYEEKMLKKKGYSKVEECNVVKCPNKYCDRLMEAEDSECLTCDKIRADYADDFMYETHSH